MGGKWKEKVLHGFKSGKDGANPNGGLVLDSKGAIYGTTFGGGNESGPCGAGGCGTAFKLKPPTKMGGDWSERILHRFERNASDGGNPMAGMRFDGEGNLYGTTFNGGPGLYGTVFCLRPPAKGTGAWVETVLHGFNDDQQGAGPAAGLIFDAHGALYGTTALATNTNAQGNVFQMKPPVRKGRAWTFHLLYTFQGHSDGAYAAANLVFGRGGSLFGTTQEGGAGQSCQGGCGIVFEASP
jgi:uncharacterized repeat protein (TIGR03803 family)